MCSKISFSIKKDLVASRTKLSIWKKPHNVYLEGVSNIFTGRNAEQFLIRVLAEDEKKSALYLIMQELLENDPIVRALDFDEESVNSLKHRIETYLDQNITLGCFTRLENTLVSIDCLYVRNIHDTFPELTEEDGNPFRIYMKYVRVIERAIFYLRHGQRKCNYLTSHGVLTLPNYRDIGIPGHMIRMRKLVARTLRIEIIGSAFIGTEMQEAAKEYNYKPLQTFNGPEDMMKIGLDFDFGKCFPINIMAIDYRHSRLEETVVGMDI